MYQWVLGESWRTMSKGITSQSVSHLLFGTNIVIIKNNQQDGKTKEHGLLWFKLFFNKIWQTKQYSLFLEIIKFVFPQHKSWAERETNATCVKPTRCQWQNIQILCKLSPCIVQKDTKLHTVPIHVQSLDHRQKIRDLFRHWSRMR